MSRGSGDKSGRWSVPEDEQLRALLGEGNTYAAVARVMGRSPTSVEHRAKALGLKSTYNKEWTQEQIDKIKELRSKGWGWERIGKEVGRGEAACRRIGKLNGIAADSVRYWKPEDLERVAILRRGGKTWAFIGRKLGRHPHACAQAMYDYGTSVKRFAKPEAEKPLVPRTCLGPNCRGARKFLSKGPENRMCQGCRESAQGLHMGHV